MNHEWSVRVRAESNQPLAASARNHSWLIGEPLSFAPKDDLPSALELAMGALAADLIGSLRRVCKLRRLDFDRAELVIQYSLGNPLTYVGVLGEEGTPALSKITGTLFVSSFDESAMHGAWQEALRRSPLVNTFSIAAEVDFRLVITP